MDFVQGLDPAKLILAGTALSFVTSPFTSPPYNLPILLFGTYAQENADAIQSLQLFAGILGGSAVFDIIWMARHPEQGGLTRLLTIILLVFKLPIFLSLGSTIRQRGALGLGSSDANGAATLWTMPGGFTSNEREGYQSVEESTANASAPPQNSRPAPAPFQAV